MLWALLLVGLSSQTQAQCTLQANIFPDTSSCPVNSLYAYATGGSQPYLYTWSNGATTNFIQGIQPGVYSVIVTSALCADTATYTVANIAPIQISSNITPESCGNRNGAINITVFGGSGNFIYNWYLGNTNIGNTEDIDSLQAGSYQVYITDLVNGCFTQGSFQVANNGGGAVTVNTTPEFCNQGNGSATAVNTGFTNPSFLWSNGATTSTISGLSQGLYSVTVSDANCNSTASANVYNNSSFTVFLWGQGCPADSLQAYVSGGQMPYTFVWSTGASTTQMNPMDFEYTNGPGTYAVTVTDNSGCSSAASFTVGTAMSATYAVQNASCAGNDGAINVSVTGGDGYYYYYWSNSQYTEDLSGLSPGFYSVQIYDSTQCTVSLDSIFVGGGGNAFVTHYSIPANCSNTGGAIQQVVSGLVNPTFIWNNGATTSALSNIASGWYGVTISDNSGCTLVRNYYVSYDSTCYIHVSGYVYNVSLSNTCTASGAQPVAYTMVRLQPGGALTFTDTNGFYDFGFTTPGNYTVEFVNNSGVYTVLCPSTNSIPVNNTTIGSNYGANNFFVTSPFAQDLSINLGHYSTVTPGFGYWTVATYCNDGQVPMSGTVEFTYDANLVFDVIWSMQGSGNPVFTGHNSSSRLLTFSFSNLQPGQCGSLYVDFNTPTNLPLGTAVSNTVTVYPLNGDATPANNTDIDNTVCVGSWDPNEKLATPVRTGNDRDGGNIYTSDEEIEYTIHFQNLGTAPAYRVVVRDELDANLLIESIRNVRMSHNGTLTIENGNVLVFTFDNINLPAASFDFHASNGYVKFTINRTAGLPIGTVINNDAAIYFDFNSPVITNVNSLTIAEITAVELLGNNMLNSVVYPNPFNSQLTLSYDLNKEGEVSVELFDALGARIRSIQNAVTEFPGTHVHQMSMGELAPGVYFLSVSTAEGRSMHKIVKQ